MEGDLRGGVFSIGSLDEEDRRLGAGAGDRQGIHPGPLRGEGEMGGRQGVADPARQRAERDDREFGRGRQRAADQRAEGEDQGISGREWLDLGRCLVGQDPGAQADAADEEAENARIQGHAPGTTEARVDPEVTAVVSGWHEETPE